MVEAVAGGLGYKKLAWWGIGVTRGLGIDEWRGGIMVWMRKHLVGPAVGRHTQCPCLRVT